jgi:alpha-glucoside transport system substrate-binding protein
MRKSWLKLAAVPVALSLVAAACGSDDDGDSGSDTTPATEAPAEGEGEGESEGGEATGDQDFGGADIVLTGPERDDPSLAGIQAALDVFNERYNANAQISGDADWEANINTQVEGGNPPDISFFPQPGKLKDFATDGSILPLPAEVDATVDEFWAEGFQVDGQSREDGTQYGVPAKTDLKSIVWYNPARFAEDGYEVPETFDEFVALVDTIAAAGGSKPLCVGIESGQATGWAFTDWTEEMVLRQHGTDVYDQWVDHSIPFNDAQIVESMQTVKDLWTDENVFASGGTIASTNFGDNAQPLVDGDCYMHRQANFFASFFPEGQAFAEEGNPDALNVFYFPDINGDRPVLSAGILAAAFQDKPEVWALMDYIATAEWAEVRQAAQAEFQGGSLSGYLSAAKGQDPSVYLPLEQQFLEILTSTDNSRFDGSDLMPADVGAGTFWSEGTSLVNGDVDVQTAADNIEASWPS